jgi:ABC-type multidrug transport system fused ATPase/permease subunit
MILLLDEATSALDSKNEKKVQDALDQIMVNKTSISIAHRLDTIRNSKLIYVFDKGRVAECGNYDELMDKRGYFYNLEKGIEFK